MIQIGNNTYAGLESELILTGRTGSFFMTTDTEKLYGYNGLGEPFLINEAEQNNFSRTIYVNSEQISGYTGTTLEERIIQFVNAEGLYKEDTDADVWIEYEEIGGIFTPEFNKEFS